MKHADGRVINCSAAGFGVIGAPAALVMRENCVSNARASGFAPIGEAPSSAPVELSQYAGNATIALPAGWTKTPAPAAYGASAIAYAKNASYDAYMLLSRADKSAIIDLKAFAETKRGAQLAKLKDATASDVRPIDVSGHTAYEADIDGVVAANGVKYKFRNTVIDAGADVIMLSVWLPVSNYSGDMKAVVDRLPAGVSGI